MNVCCNALLVERLYELAGIDTSFISIEVSCLIAFKSNCLLKVIVDGVHVPESEILFHFAIEVGYKIGFEYCLVLPD